MDFIMPLRKTGEGYDGILVILDKFSKYAIFRKCKSNISAKRTAELFMQHVFVHFGMPKTITGDKHTKPFSLFWSHLLKLLKVKLIKSSARHPQADGQRERINRILIQIFKSVFNIINNIEMFFHL